VAEEKASPEEGVEAEVEEEAAAVEDHYPLSTLLCILKRFFIFLIW
jgi:hypothetical protein